MIALGDGLLCEGCVECEADTESEELQESGRQVVIDGCDGRSWRLLEGKKKYRVFLALRWGSVWLEVGM